MNRRELMLLLVGGAMTAASALRAQQKAMPAIGFLNPTSPGSLAPFVAAFRQGLSEAGYVEGQNVTIEYRWAEGRTDRLPALAADLVSRKVDVIASTGGNAPALAAKSATSTIPIVFVIGRDPVVDGLVASLARPGGNLTGFTLLGGELTSKRLELLSELVPQARMIALLVNPNYPEADLTVSDTQNAAQAKGAQLHILKAGTEREIDAAFSTLAEVQAEALLVGGNPLFDTQREQLVALAARRAVPAIYSEREFAVAGGLISYGTSRTAAYRQAGTYAGRILNGAKPADLPVQQPTIFELVVNLNAAKCAQVDYPAIDPRPRRRSYRMNRRKLMVLLGGGMIASRGARAQQKAMRVIGFLSSEGSGALAPRLAAFRQGLSETGYVEGQTVAIEYRWAEGRFDRLPELAADLVGRKVDVIATSGGDFTAAAAKNASRSSFSPPVTRSRNAWSPVSPVRAATSPGYLYRSRAVGQASRADLRAGSRDQSARRPYEPELSIC